MFKKENWDQIKVGQKPIFQRRVQKLNISSVEDFSVDPTQPKSDLDTLLMATPRDLAEHDSMLTTI